MREDGGYVTPLECAGEDEMLSAGIRMDPTVEHGLSFWCVSDNLRKGAALNAVQIAETMIAMGPAGAEGGLTAGTGHGQDQPAGDPEQRSTAGGGERSGGRPAEPAWLADVTAPEGGRTRVAICSPAFNGERYLSEQLASFTAQTHADFRALAVNCATMVRPTPAPVLLQAFGDGPGQGRWYYPDGRAPDGCDQEFPRCSIGAGGAGGILRVLRPGRCLVAA